MEWNKYISLHYERCCHWEATALWDVYLNILMVVLCFKVE